MDRLIERKQMSTKTTFKRIALVAVAALGFGLLSVVPSSAAANTNLNCTVAYTVTDGGLCTSVAGPANFVTVTASTLSVYVVLSGGTFTDGTSSKTLAAAGTANIATPTAGTITANGYAITDGVASATAQPVVVTVGAANKGLINASTTTSYLKAAPLWASISADDASYAPKTATGAAIAAAKVVLGQANGAITTSTAVTATISGPGTLVLNNENDTSTTVIASGRAVSSTVLTTGEAFHVFVLADGVAGTATVTITAGTYTTTETVVFYGDVASLTATVAKKQIPLSLSTPAEVSVVAKDSLGQVVPGITPVVTSATTASIASGSCTASTATAASSCELTAGATAGSSVVTFTSGSITTSATVTAAAKPTAVAIAFDKAEYNPGEAFTLTLTASNAAGVPADAEYVHLLTGSLVTSQSLTVALFAASVTTVDGKATVKGYMPLAAGPVTVTGTTGADSTADVALSASVTVLSDGVAQAAADAAAEATDAANAATDAANAAAEAADAATAAAQDAADAVAALSAQVVEMVAALQAQNDSLRKQLIALTNLIIKIQKKVKA